MTGLRLEVCICLTVDYEQSLSFFCSPSSKTGGTQMATRVTDGARWERHEKREKKGKNPLTRRTPCTFNRSRANFNGPIRNTFIVFCWNQSETILLQGSPELSMSLLYMRRRAPGRDCFSQDKQTAAELPKKGKFETLKGFGGLKIYLQAWEIIGFKQQKENQLVITKKNKKPIYNQKLTEIVVGEWVQ